MKENIYLKLKNKQQEEIDNFPFGFAFNDEQFKEMMHKWGLTKNDTDKIFSLGHGSYIRKADAQAMEDMFTRHKKELWEEINKDTDGTGFIYDMFVYELANKEYCYTLDEQETLDYLGITKEDIQNNTNLKKGLRKAINHCKGLI